MAIFSYLQKEKELVNKNGIPAGLTTLRTQR